MKYLYLVGFIFLLVGCQDEEFFEEIDENTSLSSQSELSKLISRLSQNPTAFDDFIDNSHSLRLEFPFDVTIDSETTINLTEFSDYQLLINELSSDDDDEYMLEINFPVEVSLPNYEILGLQNQSEFEALKANVEGSSEINCLEFEFPLEVRIFDNENSFVINRTLQNKAQLFNLIENLKQTNGYFEMVYPITISVNDQAKSLSSNIDLNTAIENLEPSCFDTSAFSDNSLRLRDFIDFITSKQFIISNYVDDEDGNETEAFKDFRFTFNEDDSISVENLITGESFSGEWEAEIDDNELIFDINFDNNDTLEELNEDWTVEGFANPNKIILLDQDEDSEGESVLIFDKI